MSGRERRGFTLIELLVVIAVLALLISMVAPSLARTRDMAKKAVCKANLSNHGKSIAMYVGKHKTYPHFSPHSWTASPQLAWSDGSWSRALHGWAKFYAVLQENGIQGSRKTSWGDWYYDGPVEGIWHGALCPAMDATKILAAANRAGDFEAGRTAGSSSLYNVWFHKWAIGYQWSDILRAPLPTNRRYPNKIGRDGDPEFDGWYYQWLMGYVSFGDGTHGYTQVCSPAELPSPGRIIEAWDSWDIESTPAIGWTSEFVNNGWITPGWHGGKAIVAGKVMFNGYRHNSAPNLLYADGAVHSDATKRVDPDEWGLAPATFRGLDAYTWPEADPYWGNLDRVIPHLEFYHPQSQ